MEDKVVSFEVAKLAKEVGFNKISGVYFYNNIGTLMGSKVRGYNYLKEMIETTNSMFQGNILAPTQSLLQKYLREEFDIIVVVSPSNSLEYDHYGQEDSSFKASKTNELTTYGDGSHLYEHYIYKDGEFIENGEDFSTYEESLEEGLQCALNLIK